MAGMRHLPPLDSGLWLCWTTRLTSRSGFRPTHRSTGHAFAGGAILQGGSIKWLAGLARAWEKPQRYRVNPHCTTGEMGNT